MAEENAQQAQPKFEQWCVVELFGHQRIAGLVTEATIGGCPFVRVDVPTPDGEGTLYTRFFGNGAIYAINPTTKEAVMSAVSVLHPRPVTPRDHARPSLPEYTDGDYGDDDDDGDCEGGDSDDNDI